jgi:hypothetical protein
MKMIITILAGAGGWKMKRIHFEEWKLKKLNIIVEFTTKLSIVRTISKPSPSSTSVDEMR